MKMGLKSFIEISKKDVMGNFLQQRRKARNLVL
jgi:hypothetical protein